MDAAVVRFRFRPRFRALPIVTAGLGVAFLLVALLFATDAGRTYALSVGAIALVLALLYRLSPTWRMWVNVGPDALAVVSRRREHFRLPWLAIRQVVAEERTKACFVDGGAPENSLLVPGKGTPAPYRIERAEELYALILSRTPAERTERVESLREWQSRAANDAGASPDLG